MEELNNLLNSNRLFLMEILLLSATHEINNKLSVVHLEIETLENQLVKDNVERIKQIIHSVQRYSRQTNKIITYQINDGIETCLKLCEPLIKNRIKTTCHFSTIKPIQINPELLHQAIINIIIACYQLKEGTRDLFELNITTKQTQNMIKLIFTFILSSGSQDNLKLNLLHEMIKTYNGVINYIANENQNMIIIQLPAT